MIPKLRFREFIGEWNLESFSEGIKLLRGSSPRPIVKYRTTESDGVNWIKIGDTIDGSNRINDVGEKITLEGAKKSRAVFKGDIILANSMSFGKSYLLQLDGYIYDGWFVLRDYEESYDRAFLLQLLNSDYMQRQYLRLSAGGVVQNISSEIVYSTQLPKPTIKEQQKLASFLEALDQKINLLTKKKEALETYKKGLMQKIFSQELRFKREDGTDYPEWERLQLDKVASVIDPHPSHRAPKVDPNGIPFIGIGDINERGELINDKVRLVSEDIYWEQRESFKISKGDFAFCRVASVGKVIDLTDTANRIYSFSPTMAIIKPLNINAEFLRIYLSSNHFQKIAMSLVSGSTRVSLGMQNLRRLHIILPSQDEQKKISNSLSVLNHKIQLTKDSISSAQNLKKGLLQQMFV